MANKNIKGITIEIGANTKPLSNALKDINDQSRALNKELKNVNNALKLDTGNADQVARKLELLEKQAELAEEKVERLKKAQKEMDAQGISKSSDEYQKLSTQIVKAEGDLNQINKEIRITNEEFNKVSESTKLLNTYLQATGQSVDDLKNIDGISKLVNDFEAGSLGAQGFNRILQALSKELTGSASNANLLMTALSSGNLTQVSQNLNKLTTDTQGYKTEINDLQQAQNRLNTYFNATGTSVKDFANVLGSELVAKIQSGKASSQELATALDKIGASATQNRGDIDKFKATLDSVDSGVSFSSIKSELDSLGSKAKETGTDVEGLGEKLQQLNDSAEMGNLMEAGEALEPFSEGLQAIGESALEASSTVQDQLAQVRMALGATDEEAKRITEAAQQVYFAGYGESIQDCTEAATLLIQNIDGITPDNLVVMTEKATSLAQVLGVDNTEAIRGLRGAMAGFGVDADTAFDIFAEAQTRGLNLSQEMLDNIAEYAPRWKDSGVTMQEYFSLFEAGMSTGAYSSDKVLDFLNEFKTSLDDGRIEAAIGNFSAGTQELFQKYKDGEPVAEECLRAITGELGNMENQSQAATLASEMWSSLGEDNAMDMITAMSGATNGYENCTGAAQELVDVNSNSVELMGRKWEEFQLKLAPIGEKLAEVANKIMDTIGPAIDWLANAFANMDPAIQTFIIAFGAIMAVIVPIIAVIGGIVAAFGALATAIGTSVGVVIGVIAGIAAAVAAVIAIFSNWDEMVENIKEKWSILCQVLQRDWNNFVEWITGVFSSIGETLGGLWNSFCETLSNAWNTIWTGIQEGWNTIVEWFSSIFTGIGDTVGSAWNSFTQGITDAWNSIWSGIQDAWNGIASWFSEAFDNVKSTVSDIWNGFIEFLSNAWNEFWEREKTGWTNIFNFLSDTFNSIKDKATEIWNNITSFLSDTWNSIKDNANNIWNNISSFLRDTWNTVKDNASSTWNNIKDNTISTWNNLKENAGSTWDNIKSTITDHAQQIKDNLSSKWNEVVSNFSQIWSGLKDKASQIWEDVKRVVREGVDRLKDLMNFHWELPKIKLPHFSISGEFSLNPPSIPSISVDWYAKGGILTKPTIFGMNGNSLLGGGEAGKEAVAPLNDLTGMIRDAVRDEVDLTETNNLLKELIERSNIQVVLDNGVLVGTLASRMNQNLGNLAKREARQ